jgi:tetratricopeptide (TPR) repeat protein
MEAALTAAGGGDGDHAGRLLQVVEGNLYKEDILPVGVIKIIVDLFGGKQDSALRAVQQLSESFSPAEVEDWVNRAGYRLMREGTEKRALEIFEFNTRIFPKSWNSWDSLSEAHLGLGNTEEALQAHHRSLELNPSNLRGRERLRRAAITAAADGDNDRAVRLLKAAGGKETLRIGITSVAVDLFGGKEASAEQAVRKLTEHFKPEQVEQEINAAGYTLLREGQAERALELFDLNTRIFPESWNTWDSLGEVHFNLGHKEEAIKAYKKSLELNPNNEPAERMIAMIRGGKGA